MPGRMKWGGLTGSQSNFRGHEPINSMARNDWLKEDRGKQLDTRRDKKGASPPPLGDL